jgi:hypothetical protein
MPTVTAPPSPGRWVPVALLILLAIAIGSWFVYQRVEDRRAEQARRDDARAICNRWADDLDRRPTPAGVYVRWEGDRLPEKDPWGQDLRVGYSQGGIAEVLEVRSVGPDGESHTADDIVASRVAANFKGIGHGIKEGAEETSRNAAKGLVKGLVDGAREAVRGKEPEKAANKP